MGKKTPYRLYSDYLASVSRKEAEEVLGRALEHGEEHLLRLAPHFGEDWGRLPDELHNMVILTGGDLAARYLGRIGRKGT